MSYKTARQTRDHIYQTTGVHLTAKYLSFVIEYVKDFNHSRAAISSGHGVTSGGDLLSRPEIKQAIDLVLDQRMDNSHLDAEWLLYEMMDNHRIARASGNITASNTALGLLAKHVSIDAFAAVKVDVQDSTVIERLQRGRARAADTTEEVSFF